MVRRGARETAAEPIPDARDRSSRAPASPRREPSGAPPASAAVSLSELPVAGLTRRRIALALGALVAAWVIVLFARQVGEASEAVDRAETARASNVALAGQVTALQRELGLVAQLPYIEQQARRYQLGTAGEIPFRLADDAPPLAADAPGGASVRLGATAEHRTPLESWLDLLFGEAPPGG